MTFDEKIGQLFCPIVFSSDSEELSSFAKKYNMGGVLYREGKAEEIRRIHKIFRKAQNPLLTAANLDLEVLVRQ
jgi:beta-N-acetylhexosaminidase